MSRFQTGQRIKKVRGQYSIGATARVVGYHPFRLDAFNLRIRMDGPAVGTRGGKVREVPAGTEGVTDPHLWEPIVPEGAAPSEFTTLHDLLNSLSVGEPVEGRP